LDDSIFTATADADEGGTDEAVEEGGVDEGVEDGTDEAGGVDLLPQAASPAPRATRATGARNLPSAVRMGFLLALDCAARIGNQWP
jgi:hypothetical protein